MWQRVAIMHVIRQLCGDPQLMYYLFLTYDQRWEVQLDAVQALVKCLAGNVEAYIRAIPDTVDEELHLAAVGHAFQSKAHGASGGNAKRLYSVSLQVSHNELLNACIQRGSGLQKASLLPSRQRRVLLS